MENDKGTDYYTLLNRVIDDGLDEVRKAYVDEPYKMEGAIAGFEACRHKGPKELYDLLKEAQAGSSAAARNKVEADRYWRIRYYTLQIEWVCNCISVVLDANNQRVIVSPTAKAYLRVAAILGVSGGLN